MGTRNRERRRRKKLRARSAPPRTRCVRDPFDVRADAADAADAALTARLAGAVSALEQRGWRETEVRRVVRKRLGARHARILDDMRPSGDDRVVARAAAVDLLDFLARLPTLPRERRGAAPASGIDSRILERVRALLAKAESTTFPEESEALTAKAQQLMARHAIDRALLDATSGTGRGASSRRIGIDDPYPGPKYLLAAMVADANRCRAVWSKAFGFVTVFGGDDDLDAVELLYTSLLCQAASAMHAAGGSSRSFRHAFLVAYAGRIGARLAEATAKATTEAADEHGADRLLPVLADRSDAAEAAAREAFPHTRTVGFSARDGAGWVAGIAAADAASLDLVPGVEGPGAPAGALS